MALVASGCGSREERTNVRPPAPGIPQSPADVSGIYRTIHQGLMQLRADGEFVLVIVEGPGPSAGSYTLDNGRMTIVTDKCGDTVGEYDVVVTGVQLPDEAKLELTAVDDPCRDRSYYLTLTPWIYAVS